MLKKLVRARIERYTGLLDRWLRKIYLSSGSEPLFAPREAINTGSAGFEPAARALTPNKFSALSRSCRRDYTNYRMQQFNSTRIICSVSAPAAAALGSQLDRRRRHHPTPTVSGEWIWPAPNLYGY